MPNSRPRNRRKESAEQSVSASSVLKPVAVSSSSLESAGAAPPSAALALDHFDFDDFTNDAMDTIIPHSAISPGIPSSHSGAPTGETESVADDAVAAGDDEATASGSQTNTVPEFLYQLTKLLTDDNRDAIEWSHGKLSCFVGPNRKREIRELH